MRSSDLPANAIWGDGWAALRAEWSLDPSVNHFNHGAFGAVPRPVRAAQYDVHAEIDANPSHFYRRVLDDRLEAARQRAADFCRADAGGFAFVRNTSEGMTVALASLRLGDGDEVVVTNHRYPAVRLAVERRCGQSGARQVEARIPMTGDAGDIVDLVLDRVGTRTRAVVIDAVASHSGLIFPVREIARAVHDRDGITVIVDAAHAPGALPMDVGNLGADIWVANFHKWTCAPNGAAGVWAAPAFRDALRPPSVGYRDLLGYPSRFGRLGTDDLTPLLAVPRALRFVQDLGETRIRDHNRRLARRGAGLISEALGTQPFAGQFTARHPVALPDGVAMTPDAALGLQTAIADELHTELSVTPPIGGSGPAILAVCAFVYNHPDEYAGFAEQFAQWLPGFLART